MESLLNAALDNAVQVSLLAVVVLTIDWTVRRPAFVHWLWVLLLIKLLTPPFMVLPVPGRAPAARILCTPRPPTDMEWKKMGGPAPSELGPRLPPQSRRELERHLTEFEETTSRIAWRAAAWVPPRWTLVASWAWLSLSAAWLTSILFRFLRASRLLRSAVMASESLQERGQELAGRMGLRRCPAIVMFPGAISPMLWAVGGPPRLLLPRDLWDRLDQAKQDALLVHELAHLRRCDHWVRILELVVISLYWWNPVAWWARRALHDSEERCCDAWVVTVLPNSARAYAAALLDTVDYLAEAKKALPLGASGAWRLPNLRLRLALIMRGGIPRDLSRVGAVGIAALAATLIPLKPSGSLTQAYRITDLGSLDPAGSSAGLKINNLGQVLGRSKVAGGGLHAFLTAPNRPIDPATDDLGLIEISGGEPRASDETDPSRIRLYDVTSVNDAGQIVGTLVRKEIASSGMQRGRSMDHQRGFRAQADRLAKSDVDWLGRLSPEDNPSAADINSSGQVVGHAGSVTKAARAFRTAPNRPFDPATDYIGSLGGVTSEVFPPVSFATAINDAGQVAGTSLTTTPYVHHAFRTAPNQPINPATDDLGCLGIGNSYANAINDLGQVVGVSDTNTPERHAFRTAPNQPINPATDDLGTLGGFCSEAKAINNSGRVVGVSFIRDYNSFRVVGGEGTCVTQHAFVHDGKRMIDLNTLIDPDSGWDLTQAHDINDRGQIVGFGVNPSEQQHAFVLTPVAHLDQFLLLGIGTMLSGLGFGFLRVREKM